MIQLVRDRAYKFRQDRARQVAHRVDITEDDTDTMEIHCQPLRRPPFILALYPASRAAFLKRTADLNLGRAKLHRCALLRALTIFDSVTLSKASTRYEEDTARVQPQTIRPRADTTAQTVAASMNIGASFPSFQLKSLREFPEDLDVKPAWNVHRCASLRISASSVETFTANVFADAAFISAFHPVGISEGDEAAGARANDARFDGAAGSTSVEIASLQVHYADLTPDFLLQKPALSRTKKHKFATIGLDSTIRSTPIPRKTALPKNVLQHAADRTKSCVLLGAQRMKIATAGSRRSWEPLHASDIRAREEGESARSENGQAAQEDVEMVRWLNPFFVIDRLSQVVRDADVRISLSFLLGPHIPFLRAKLAIGRDRVPSPATSEDRGSSTRGVRAVRCGFSRVMEDDAPDLTEAIRRRLGAIVYDEDRPPEVARLFRCSAASSIAAFDDLHHLILLFGSAERPSTGSCDVHLKSVFFASPLAMIPMSSSTGLFYHSPLSPPTHIVSHTLNAPTLSNLPPLSFDTLSTQATVKTGRPVVPAQQFLAIGYQEGKHRRCEVPMTHHLASRYGESGAVDYGTLRFVWLL
ncbi:hypothetical protein B0H16DRAFT_1811894 [Mycena metata]|uniref:Uncharacterized protein n=1 Tax=Mycena metata TaxID=1033252 RepID=A0AAD7H5A2_9AGAR|nr:hypothetical protein B0H16DRAFT_1811894 [Mycena metata]